MKIVLFTVLLAIYCSTANVILRKYCNLCYVPNFLLMVAKDTQTVPMNSLRRMLVWSITALASTPFLTESSIAVTVVRNAVRPREAPASQRGVWWSPSTTLPLIDA